MEMGIEMDRWVWKWVLEMGRWVWKWVWKWVWIDGYRWDENGY